MGGGVAVTPVPVRLTRVMGLVSDELGALLKIVKVAVRVPMADGAKFNENLQVAPGGTDAP